MQLDGCVSEPLLHYLKALGVLRLVVEQRRDTDAKGAWREGRFELHTRLDREGLLQFFLEDYCPTPLITPWNSASGFWGGAALSGIRESDTVRLESFRQVVVQAEGLLRDAGWRKKPSKRDKSRVLRLLRSNLPDAVVPWLDAVALLDQDHLSFAPLLGTGGTDGRLEFAANFVGRLKDVIPFKAASWKPSKAKRSREWLEAALYAVGSPKLVKAAVGHFHPGGIGGPNATQGFEGPSLVNPWDYVLMMEGTLVLACPMARRAGHAAPSGRGRFSCTTYPSVATWGSGSRQEADSARAELWLPLWERPAGLAEATHLLAEGRTQVGGRAASSGLDFARAIASHGIEQGVAGFTRYGLAQRSGRDNHIALPLGYMPVPERANARIQLIEELEPWLAAVRYAAKEVPNPARALLLQALGAVDKAIWHLAQADRADSLQGVLFAMARLSAQIGRSTTLRKRIVPCRVPVRWAEPCNDGSIEFRLARSLASIHAFPPAAESPPIEPLRAYLEPVRLKQGRYVWAPDSPQHTWSGDDLCRNLTRVLERRCRDALRRQVLTGAPVAGSYPAHPADIDDFLTGKVDDQRLGSLLRGLALLGWPIAGIEGQKPRGSVGSRHRTAIHMMPRLYALAKLLFHCGPLPRQRVDAESGERAVGTGELALRTNPAVLTALSRGDARAASSLTARRLRAARFLVSGAGAGHGPRGVPEFICDRPERVAAALLFPLSEEVVYELMKLVLRNPDGI